MLTVTGSQPAPILGRRLLLGRRVVVAQPRGHAGGARAQTDVAGRRCTWQAETGERNSARPHLAHRTQLPISAFDQLRRIGLEKSRHPSACVCLLLACESIPRSRVDGKRCAMPLWRAPSECAASYPLS